MFYNVEFVEIIFWSVKPPDGKRLINVLRCLFCMFINIHLPNWQFLIGLDHCEVTGAQAWVSEHA